MLHGLLCSHCCFVCFKARSWRNPPRDISIRLFGTKLGLSQFLICLGLTAGWGWASDRDTKLLLCCYCIQAVSGAHVVAGCKMLLFSLADFVSSEDHLVQ